MTGQREAGDRRAGALVALAVLLGAGAAWFFLLQRKSGPGEAPLPRLAAPVVSVAMEPEPEEAEESEEPDDSRLYAESGMTFDEFIKVLEKEAPKPVAAAVVEAFRREPELRDI